MSLPKQKREKIKRYILEKIENEDANMIQKTVNTFGISQQTVYRYIRKMNQEGLIEKKNETKSYQLCEEHFVKIYDNSSRNLEEDKVYKESISPHIQDLPENIQKIWAYSFTEMFNNAIDHSEASEIVCSLSKSYLATTIIILDRGIGIFNKICKYYNFETLDEAIAALFKGKITTDSKNHSGEGIFFTSRILDYFVALSSKKIFSHCNYNDCIDDLENVPLNIDNEKGTIIFMRLSNFTKKTVKEVLDMYADVDGGFTKTNIPIKNVFENGYPVSRSQAKRLYAGLDKFKEVEIDFNGVEEIGQGFAHELFFVFVNDNPEITLKVINANENVQKMINHVKQA